MFSVVITTKDRIDFLQRCVNSVCCSSVLPSEIIIVNDSEGPVSDQKIDSKVKLVIVNNKTSLGANYSRNIGVERALNEIVFFIDDDDAVEYDSFKSRLSLFQDDLVGLVYTGVKIVHSTNIEQVKRTITPRSSDNYYLDLLSFGNFVGPTSGAAIRKKYFYLAGQFDEALACRQDYDLWIRLSKISKVKTDFLSTVIYTIHANSAQISNGHRKFLKASEYLYSKYGTDIDEYRLKNKFFSSSYYRVAQIASKENDYVRIKYSILSLSRGINIKSIALLFIPTFIIKKIRLFT